ncbi:MAG: ABC transporter permease [Bryobacteraceae bacterium]
MNEMRSHQLQAVVQLEWKRSFFNRRSWWIYLLAFGPTLVAGLHTMKQLQVQDPQCQLSADLDVFAGIFQLFYLRLGIFFGCVGLFSNLFRGEILSKTLHYWFLTPVRREIVVAGKYLAGVLAASTIFGVAVVSTYLLIGYHHTAELAEFFATGPGKAHLYWYLLTAVLACFGYGAIFLASGLLIRNPLIPAVVILVWEGGNSFLPPLLQKISAVHYLKSLCPTPVRLDGLDALLAVSVEPTPPVLAIAGLLGLSAVILGFAAMRARTTEISYSE